MRLKFLLQPGWIALILLVAAFTTLCFTFLAPWQFGRNDERKVRNEAIAESLHAAPKPLAEVLPAGRAPDQRHEWAKVTFSGNYLPAGETLAWLRSVQGEPALEVLTPFRTDSGETLLVDRGFLRQRGTHAPDFDAPPAGRVTLTARVRVDEHDDENRPTFQREGHRWTYSIDSSVLSQGTGMQLRPGYFALVDGQPGVLGPLPLPQLESGPFFSYALQWISFGIMAVAGVGYLIYAETRPEERVGSVRKSRKMSVAEAVAEDERREQEQREQQGEQQQGEQQQDAQEQDATKGR